jgi:hypothetical protein
MVQGGISARAPRGVLTAIGSVLSGMMASTTVLAAHIEGLRPEPDLPLPSATRVVVAAALTIALAIGALWLLKRWLPRLNARAQNGSAALKVLGRTSLSRSLRVHVVEIEATRFLIVEGRGGVDLAVLPPATGDTHTPGEHA